jgi:hypothetical protein
MAVVPRQIVPMIHPASLSMIAPAAHLNFHGGQVLGAVQVVPIFWGAFWGNGDGAQLVTLLEGFFDLILSSSLMDLLAEFSTDATPIGHGSRLPSVRVLESEPGDPTATGRQVSDDQIQQALQGFIAAGTVPATTANTLYFLYLPPNCVSTLGVAQSCKGPGGFCGYHSNINQSIFYAVEPFITCPGCSFGTILDSLTKVSSHELAEAITDPAGDGWFDDTSGDEIGDICNTSTAHLGGFLVQNQWSNAQGGCVIAP